jgi:single-strand DNA-binding protein
MFFDVKSWGKQAEIASQHLEKGNIVAIEGHLEQESWNDKTTGQKRTKSVIITDKLELLPQGSGVNQKKEEPQKAEENFYDDTNFDPTPVNPDDNYPGYEEPDLPGMEK